ncbi:uncharacterized protein SPAPADRAFT_63413 [Spathaspora passalidarum NRRL Y-27907]|uniref:CCZ1/INTU/HSP4 first Longin domain-containing protein n=1 Tax=Spathaspora passalidarum (strain NRRL Y-27907 / 11-Y1) TaxID=619300 RepID=G3AUM0_SPAPN|nr:uncharacterized protein SPAPADRAFT_63413 [Spathaspora passalidarum NRRL Y-27907]EGW30575.1 hypothetical protein SPAPADRAFT_63413 [Spathaspora passalidarum NRRL Y-27907]
MSNLNFECDNASHNSDYSSGLLQVLNPVNITNSLVVSPLNYTMNGMRSIIGNEAPLSNNDQVQQGQHTEEVSWLSLPQFMRNFSMRDAGPANNIIQEEEQQQDPIEPAGHYIIGLTENGTIIKKSVYLQGREFQLIIYGKGDIYIMLVYEPSTDIGTTEFYDGLKLDLNPIIEDINTEGGSIIQTSLSSLRGLLSNKVAPEVDQDFFYVILDPQEGSFQTSLPYLPTITSDTPRYQIAMCYLHDQLTNLFLIQQSEFFMQANKLNEYFHKFTGNKLNDWMFYYIHKNNKFIIIIKNKNKTSHSESKVEQSLLGKLNGVLDLGFLDSLGDDVKYWLGKEVAES